MITSGIRSLRASQRRRQSQTFISVAEQGMVAVLFSEGCLATTASTRSQVSSLRLHTPGSAVKVCVTTDTTSLLQSLGDATVRKSNKSGTSSTWAEFIGSDSCSLMTKRASGKKAVTASDGKPENWWNRSLQLLLMQTHSVKKCYATLQLTYEKVSCNEPQPGYYQYIQRRAEMLPQFTSLTY